MPSWNEKPHTTPLINVNLKRCDHPDLPPVDERGWHEMPSGNWLVCAAGAPVLIPCPLPRSVTFMVRLGECDCPGPWQTSDGSKCFPNCPSQPIKVSCSIAGDTWEASHIADTETPAPMMPLTHMQTLAVRARWALVKALVLGFPSHAAFVNGARVEFTTRMSAIQLRQQRDAVFAALCDMAKAEQAAYAAFLALPMDIRRSSMVAKAAKSAANGSDEVVKSSGSILAHYVAHLVEQVGVLT